MSNEKNITLVVLAAGIGSRYGKLKQLDGVGPSDETLIEYSVYDAIRAGVNKVVFVIQRSFAAEFQTYFDQKISDQVEVAYVYQDKDIAVAYPQTAGNFRKKPWGTGHAILCAKNEVHNPFIVINADDYYGYESYRSMVYFLKNSCTDSNYALCTYRLKNTLSKNGSVSRGVCHQNENGILEEVVEHTKIFKSDSDQIISEKESGGQEELDENTPVSMNFWGFDSNLFIVLEREFQKFLSQKGQEAKAEFFIPDVISMMMKTDGLKVSVLDTEEKWYGLTYSKDRVELLGFFSDCFKEGRYPKSLWG